MACSPSLVPVTRSDTRVLAKAWVAAMATDPDRGAQIPEPELPTVLSVVTEIQAMLLQRIGASADGLPPAPADDRLLTPKEAAALVGVTVVWLYRHAHQLPATRRLSRKVLRFSERGLQDWIRDGARVR